VVVPLADKHRVENIFVVPLADKHREENIFSSLSNQAQGRKSILFPLAAKHREENPLVIPWKSNIEQKCNILFKIYI
jgi:hypothetical protein